MDSEFPEERLGSAQERTGLCITVMRQDLQISSIWLTGENAWRLSWGRSRGCSRVSVHCHC